MHLKLQTIGDLRLSDKDGKPVAYPEKGLLILAYLFCAGAEEISRRRLATLLWSESPLEVAQTNLRQTISRIVTRQAEIGMQPLFFDRFAIRLNRASLVCDFSIVENEADIKAPMSDLRAIMAVFKATFLESANIPSGKLSTWRDGQRQKAIDRLANAIIAGAGFATTASDKRLIDEASACLFQHDPGHATAQIFHCSADKSSALGTIRNLFDLTTGHEAFAGSSALHAARNLYEAQKTSAATSERPQIGDISVSPLPRIALLPPADTPLGLGAMIAQSLVEDVTVALAASRDLQVVAPYTSAKIGLSNDKPGLFEKHRISYVLETRHSSNGAQSFLFVQLVHFANDEVIWAERLSLDHLALVQNRGSLASRLSLTVSDQIGRAERTREYFEKFPDAYYHYLVGQRYINQLNLPSLRRARREFRTALTQSGDFAPALSGIARSYTKEWLLTARGDEELLKTAEDYARHAIRIGQDLASGYRELGVSRLLRGAIDESVDALNLAESMSPHYADVIADYADTLVHASRPEQALAKIRFAIDLNPISPDSYLWTAAGASYSLKRYGDALGFIGQMRDGELATRLAAASWAMLGENKKARKLVAKARETHPDFDLDRWLSVIPMKEQWQQDHYREGLRKAGF